MHGVLPGAPQIFPPRTQVPNEERWGTYGFYGGNPNPDLFQPHRVYLVRAACSVQFRGLRQIKAGEFAPLREALAEMQKQGPVQTALGGSM